MNLVLYGFCVASVIGAYYLYKALAAFRAGAMWKYYAALAAMSLIIAAGLLWDLAI